ncbi:MAG: HNH endonuclease [Candidatus Thiodiazotropha endolucinida]|uniref:HNH endonuclease n=1 Tax=Candidatus Thiodiazotropha taylori TaxID=2792791 RepID=A0A9E4NHP9_9GAMM|nr:HNH endonuclease [Candidatus Thiodiazotropha taylori]MCW4235619.1 HNH endonuclease [Candidatus Thiodiazotropha endolucinida]
MENLYCPYCNKTKTSKFTDEHFIPQLISGENTPTIRICSECNSTLGKNVDILLTHHSFLIGLGPSILGRPISRHSRIETEVTLKDNRILTGYLFLETVDEKKNTFKYGFRPHRTQGDGTKWIYEGGIKDPTKVPKDINILKEGMWKLVRLTGPLKYRDKSIPALIKILMGFICWDVLSKKK